MDIIQECALAFESLLKYEYHFVIGRKGDLKEFYLRFDKSDFHHLLGLHKLRDIAQIQQGKRDKIFDKILAGDISLKLIQKSAFYEQMCRTFFPVGDKDYTVGQPQYTLLKKEKRNLLTEEVVVQYDRLTPKEDKKEINK